MALHFSLNRILKRDPAKPAPRSGQRGLDQRTTPRRVSRNRCSSTSFEPMIGGGEDDEAEAVTSVQTLLCEAREGSPAGGGC